MTLAASYAEPFGNGLPSHNEQEQASHARRVLAGLARSDEPTELTGTDDAGNTAQIILSPLVTQIMMELLRALSRGDAVTLVPVNQKLTTQQAADLLNVSRPYLIKLLDQKAMPFEMVGRHRRISAKEVFAYKRRMQREREEAMVELAKIGSDLI